MDAEGLDPRCVLDAYDIGQVDAITFAGGTAGGTWRVESGGGVYFLRRRGARTSSRARLEFDHGLRGHLVAQGLPTAAAVPTRDDRRWVRTDSGVYELYPFVSGRSFDPDSTAEVADAARTLARFHQIAKPYRTASVAPEPVAQYTALGFSDAVSDRMDDPALLLENTVAVRALAPTDVGRAVVDRCVARAEAMRLAYAGPAYAALAGWIIHGDYTPANLLFSDEGRVVGVFDLDWAVPGARCRDVADGLYFFATRPRRIDSSDIWSLTDAAEFAPDRCVVFLRAHQEVSPLADCELDALPVAFAGRWLSIRLEGMAKVDPSDRFRFFAREIEEPLRWLDANWQGLRSRLAIPDPPARQTPDR